MNYRLRRSTVAIGAERCKPNGSMSSIGPRRVASWPNWWLAAASWQTNLFVASADIHPAPAGVDASGKTALELELEGARETLAADCWPGDRV